MFSRLIFFALGQNVKQIHTHKTWWCCSRCNRLQNHKTFVNNCFSDQTMLNNNKQTIIYLIAFILSFLYDTMCCSDCNTAKKTKGVWHTTHLQQCCFLQEMLYAILNLKFTFGQTQTVNTHVWTVLLTNFCKLFVIFHTNTLGFTTTLFLH